MANTRRTASGTSWLEPTAIAEDPGLVDVVVGPGMICGFTAGRQAYCLGNPPHWMLEPTEAPMPLAPALDIASLALGNTQTCAITAEGAAYCWGSNEDGQLGSGDASLGWGTPRGVWAP